MSTTTVSDLILNSVHRVRNNLFHGGKFNGRWFVAATQRGTTAALPRGSYRLRARLRPAPRGLRAAVTANEPPFANCSKFSGRSCAKLFLDPVSRSSSKAKLVTAALRYM
jgi:hypothetical protein